MCFAVFILSILYQFTHSLCFSSPRLNLSRAMDVPPYLEFRIHQHKVHILWAVRMLGFRLCQIVYDMVADINVKTTLVRL